MYSGTVCALYKSAHPRERMGAEIQSKMVCVLCHGPQTGVHLPKGRDTLSPLGLTAHQVVTQRQHLYRRGTIF